MKISLDILHKEHSNVNEDISFSGYKPVKNEYGFKEYEFSYPFDEDKQNCYLEIFSVDEDFYNNYKINRLLHASNGKKRIKLNNDLNRINLTKTFGIDENTPFAYHYIIENKSNPSDFKVQIDAGDSIDDRPRNHDAKDSRIYNIVPPARTMQSKGGAMKLIIPDAQNVGVVYKKDGSYTVDKNKSKASIGIVKHLWNRLGGSLAGVEKDLDEGKYDMYSRIISLPIFGRDNLSAHGYWTEELYQIAPHLGSLNNYSSLQRKLFSRGINWVADGAFVNEGLQGVHFNHILKWGEDSPFFNWFNGQSLNGSVWNLGIFPRNAKYCSHKLVNSPILYTQNSSGDITRSKNPKYDPKKPTYIQYFDKRLVTEAQLTDTQNIISSYEKQPDNIYTLGSYNDSMYPYHFQIDPKEYDKNVDRLREYNLNQPLLGIVEIGSPAGTRMLSKFSTWNAEEMFEGGFETWNANPDIPKLKFVFSNEDYKRLKNLSPRAREIETNKILRANAQVQDYTIEAGKYWTKLTNDIHRLYVAQNLGNIKNENPELAYNEILKKSDNKIFPSSLKYEITKGEVENVLSDMYNCSRKFSEGNKQEQVLKEIMDFPLESLEFGSNILSVISTPYISKRANNVNEIGVSRYELFKKGTPNLEEKYRPLYNKTENILKDGVYPAVIKVLDSVNSQLPGNSKLFENNEVTEFGKYVLPLIVPSITKYILVKSLIPDLGVNINNANGDISYDYERMRNTSLEGIGVKHALSVEDEANKFLNVLDAGVGKVSSSQIDEISSAICKSLKGTSAESFKLADLIIDKTQAGLDWRIDATKDIADVEALYNKNANFEDTLQAGVDFWSRYDSNIYKVNPNSHIIFELTDEDDMHMNAWGSASAKYPHNNDIEPKTLRETWARTIANYSYMFNDISKLFTKSCEDASYLKEEDIAGKIKDILIGANHAFLKSASLESIMYSYTFVDNHDKPRMLHCAAMDMGLFYANLNDINNREYRRQAYMVIKNKYLDNISDAEIDSFDFSKVSPKAVAMGMAIHKAAIDVLNEKYSDLPKEEFNRAFIAISKSVTDLVSGKYMGKRFDPDNFGVNPFDVNIESVVRQAKTYYSLPRKFGADYCDKVFERALDPAISKLLGMMKYLVALPGMPTLFDGDDYGATGYEAKTRNIFKKCRSKRHEERIDKSSDKYKDFIAKHKKEFDNVMSIRRKAECNALNNGAPYVLPMQCAYTTSQPHNESNCNIDVPAVFRQSTDGRMAICLLNPKKHHNDMSKYNKYDYSEYYTPEHLQLNEIRLNYGKGGVFMDGAMGVGISGIKPGTIFRNANNPNDTYKVEYSKGYYYLKRQNNQYIDLNDTTLILYSAEGKPLSFTGQDRVKPSSRFITSTYSKPIENKQLGQKLII